MALRRIQAHGTPLATITSEISQLGPHLHVGIDNRLAGDTAAYLCGKFSHRSGKVLVLVTSMKYRVHIQRVAGFTRTLRDQFSGLTTLAPLEHQDRPELARQLIQRAYAEHPDIIAIYNAGSASQAIHEQVQGLPAERRPIWIGHELTREHARLMQAGSLSAVIDQEPELQARHGLNYLLHACDPMYPDPGHARTRFRIVTPANLISEELMF